MASGEMTREQFSAFLGETLAALLPLLADGAIVFVAMDWRHIEELTAAGNRCGLVLKNLCVWVKTNAGMGTFYRSQHELIFVFKHGQGAHQNNFELGQHGRTRSNVWRYAGVNTFGKNRMDLLGAHPTVKPVAMIADALKDVTRRGDLVLDTFLGSGSTLLAAEQTGRTCIGIELEPGYVAVAIRRWQKLTGKDAVHAVTGETFDGYMSASRRRARIPSLRSQMTPDQFGHSWVPRRDHAMAEDKTGYEVGYGRPPKKDPVPTGSLRQPEGPPQRNPKPRNRLARGAERANLGPHW